MFGAGGRYWDLHTMAKAVGAGSWPGNGEDMEGFEMRPVNQICSQRLEQFTESDFLQASLIARIRTNL